MKDLVSAIEAIQTDIAEIKFQCFVLNEATGRLQNISTTQTSSIVHFREPNTICLLLFDNGLASVLYTESKLIEIFSKSFALECHLYYIAHP
jgi:hypothetical protein